MKRQSIRLIGGVCAGWYIMNKQFWMQKICGGKRQQKEMKESIIYKAPPTVLQ